VHGLRRLLTVFGAALLIYRAAVAAAVGSFSLVGDAPILLLAAVGSLAAGYVLARLPRSLLSMCWLLC